MLPKYVYTKFKRFLQKMNDIIHTAHWELLDDMFFVGKCRVVKMETFHGNILVPATLSLGRFLRFRVEFLA